jgi:hypothetical protein
MAAGAAGPVTPPEASAVYAPITVDQRPKTRLAELIGVDAGDA